MFEEVYAVDKYDPPMPPSKLEKSITAHVFRTGEPLLLTKTAFEKIKDQDDYELVGTSSAAWLGVPLKTPNGMIGVMVVQDYENEDCYSVRDKEFLTSIGLQVSLLLERMQTDQELHRLNQALDNSSEAIFMTDREGVITFVNPGFTSLYGYTVEETVGKTTPRILKSGNMKPEEYAAFWQTLQNKEVVTGEILNKTKDGRQINIENSANPILNQQEEIVGFLAIQRDITERKQKEIELRESKALFETVVENIPLMIFLKEAADLRFVMFNKAGEELLGYDRTALLGKNNLDLFPPEQAENFMTKDREVLDGKAGMLDIPEEPIQTAKKGERLLHTRKVSVQGTDGVSKYLLGISEDITERKQAEEALRESEELFSLFLKHSPIYTYIKAVTPSESRNLKISDNFQDMLGIPASEMVGKTMDELFPAELAAKMTADDWSVISNGVVLNLDEDFNGRNYSSIKFPIRQGDKTLLAGYTMDITERKQEEEKLQVSEQMHRTILETSINGYLLVDMQGSLLEVNQTYCRMSGYTDQELLGMHIPDLDDKEMLSDTASHIQKIMEQGTDRFESRHRRKDGSLFDVEVSVQYRTNKGGQFVVFLQDISDRKTFVDKLQKTVVGTVNTIALIVEARDPYTSGHQKRVAEISVAIAKELGLPEEQIQGIYFSSLIHDLGKIQVPSEILSKPGKLTRLEFELIKTHSEVGYELLKGIEFPWPIAEIVYQHHERENGSGYPRKLKGKRIIIEAKIIALADVIEAISSHRPYRPALGIDFALDEINKNKGILYDPDIVEAFIKIIEKVETIIPSP
jgi:PAS domain S-box-containing protein